MISVLMPVYNAELYLEESIQSILNQTLKDFDFLIIDDGSLDNSNEIIQKFLVSDSRIRLVTLVRNQGLIGALNLGLQRVHSKYLVRMDADDIAHPKRLEVLLDLMETHPDISILGSDIVDLESRFPKFDTLKLINYRLINSISIFNCPIFHPTVIIRTDFLKKNGLIYNLTYKHAEDNALWLDSISKGKICSINFPLLKYRKHKGQVSNIHWEEQHANSTLRRVQLLEEISGLCLSDKDKRIYQAISYKYGDLQISDFDGINVFVKKLKYSVLIQDSIDVDYQYFLKLLYSRISLLYFRNSELGSKLLINYLSNFVFDFRIFIFFRLVRRIVYGI